MDAPSPWPRGPPLSSLLLLLLLLLPRGALPCPSPRAGPGRRGRLVLGLQLEVIGATRQEVSLYLWDGLSAAWTDLLVLPRRAASAGGGGGGGGGLVGPVDQMIRAIMLEDSLYLPHGLRSGSRP